VKLFWYMLKKIENGYGECHIVKEVKQRRNKNESWVEFYFDS